MKLNERAALMRLTIGLPGEQRQDADLSKTVKEAHNLGERSGRWIKSLYPEDALKPIKKLDNEARSFHDAVTLPFEAGIGILPAALILEYGDRMRDFKGRRENLVENHFLAKYEDWVEWAKKEHNGTFDQSMYPGVDKIREKFYFRTEPLPVPSAAHFQNTVSSLLGTDVESVEERVRDATKEAQQELMRRLVKPVKYMAETLSKEKPKIFDTIISNIEDIVKLAPSLNLSGDVTIDTFVKEMQALTQFDPDRFRKSEVERAKAAASAKEVLTRLEAYKL